MSNGDAGVPTETSQPSTERDLGRELTQASEVGKMVFGIARERAERPQFRVRKYTMPMLDPRGFPQEAVKAVVLKREQITDDDIKAAKEASVALAIESVFQIVEAKPTSGQVMEDSDSLKQMFRMVKQGAGLVIQIEASDPQAVVKAGRTAIEKRDRAKGLKEVVKRDDQEVLAWTKEMFQRAGSRLGKSLDAIDALRWC